MVGDSAAGVRPVFTASASSVHESRPFLTGDWPNLSVMPQAAVIPFPKASVANRRLTFDVLRKALDELAGDGDCPTISEKLAAAFSGRDEVSREAQVVLRARCGVCPRDCEKRLPPIMTRAARE